MDAVVVSVEEAVVEIKFSIPSIGRRPDGGGPPTTVVGHVVEISDVVAMAARQGIETRSIRHSRVR